MGRRSRYLPWMVSSAGRPAGSTRARPALQRPRVRIRLALVTALAAATAVVLPAAPAAASSYVGISAPQYESPGGTVPVVVTLHGLPSQATVVAISARGTNSSTARCAGSTWVNRRRATASRTCYLTLPPRTGAFRLTATATAYWSGRVLLTRRSVSSRAVLGVGPVSRATLSAATIRSIERCQNPGREVWLTFDDGASATQLGNILATLSSNNVRGRFFFTGAWRDQHPALYRRLLRSGHFVANHSYDHPALSKQSSAEVVRQIRRGVQATTTPRLLRPPFGAGALTSRLQNLAGAQGYRLCRWTVDTFDWDQATPAGMRERVVTGDYRTPPIAAGGNVLMHGTARYTSVGGLQAVIDGVRARHLTMQPLRIR